MNTYRVKRIHRNPNMSYSEYWNMVFNAPIHHCTGIKELREYCGGKLHYSKQAGAYMGINNNIEYVAEKC